MSAPSATPGAASAVRARSELRRSGLRHSGLSRSGLSRSGLSRSGKVRAVLALGAVVGLGTVATLAAWSDTGAATGSFSTGSLDLKLQGQDGTVAVTNLAMSNATPGTVVYANLPVTNAGTVAFTYGFTVTSTNGTDTTPLNANLNWGIVSLGTSASCTAATYTAAAGVTATNISPTTTLSSAPAVSGRALAAGATENLCFRVELPAAAPSGVQGRSTVATVSFTATQS